MNVPMLSSYPANKLVVSCGKCGLLKQFDKAAMLKAGGDRPLGLLLDDIAVRANCPKRKVRPTSTTNVAILYPELVGLMKAAGRY